MRCSTDIFISAAKHRHRRRAGPAVERRAFLVEMGAKIVGAVTTTKSPLLEKFPAEEVLIGDLEDLEQRARAPT